MKTIARPKKFVVDFAKAQQLYTAYSPYKTNEDLREILVDLFGFGFVSEASPRDIVNQILINSYPNEAVIKAGFINDILIKSNNHVSIFELSVGTSRADLCKINGESTAFEIKTDLDNIQRLEKQLHDYSTVFERVYLICSENKSEQMIGNIPVECGLYSYKKTSTGRYKFTKQKEAEYSPNLSSRNQLPIFTKRELSYYFGVDGKLDRSELHCIIRNKFTSNQINDSFKLCLKQKYNSEWEFLTKNRRHIQDIDYQWFFKYKISPELVYK